MCGQMEQTLCQAQVWHRFISHQTLCRRRHLRHWRISREKPRHCIRRTNRIAATAARPKLAADPRYYDRYLLPPTNCLPRGVPRRVGVTNMPRWDMRADRRGWP
uniref:Uncharacterized protein n=1 Tax=Cacopsylla melanoneura TaxID=428564 RepID=A0A8D8YVS4_9HEMI